MLANAFFFQIKQAEYDAKLKQNKQENMKLRTQVNGNRKVEEFMRELIVDAKYKAEVSTL